jgi:hypothetical protein
MKKREPLIFSEQFFRGVDEAVAGAIASSEAAGLPKSYLDSYDQLPAKPVKSVQDFIFSEKLQKAVDESIARAVAESEAAGRPRSYLHSYDELPEFLAQLQERNKSAE